MRFLLRMLPVLGLVIQMMTWGCAAHTPTTNFDTALFSAQVQGLLRTAVQSVVGVSAFFTYRTETYNHRLVNGRFVPDANSPTGFQLDASVPDRKIVYDDEIQRINGAGLIIFRDERMAAVLTSAHILNKKDTIDVFYRDGQGRLTDVLLSRSIKRSASFQLFGQVNQYIRAEVVRVDMRTDLGMLVAPSTVAIGIAYPYGIAYDRPLEWGDFAYVVGFPRETKQLTSGLVSPSSYGGGSFVLDTVARFGFSGGPVFIIRQDRGLELAGIVRGVPSTKFFYVAPPDQAAPGQFLSNDDLKSMSAEEYDLIDYGTTYAIGAEPIGRFIKSCARDLEREGIALAAKYFDD